VVLAQDQGRFCFSLCPNASRLGWARGWEGSQPEELTLSGQEDIPSCSAVKQRDSFSKITIAWRVAEHQSADGRW